jgi:hypothetical protein
MYRDDSEWAAEDGQDRRAAIATAISSALLLLTTCSRTTSTVGGGAEGLAFMLGGITASIALFWGIPFAIAIRKASLRWKIGSFVTIAVLGVLSNLWLAGSADQRVREGLDEQRRQTREVAEGKRTRLEAGADANPLERIAVELGNRSIADLQAYYSELIAAGAERMARLRGLRLDSAELRNCGKFAELASKARSNGAIIDTYLVDARSKLDKEVTDGSITQGAADDFMRGATEGKPMSARTWELQAQNAEAVGGLCQVLARRNWRIQKGRVAFTSEADLADANAQLEKIRQISAEQERMKSQSLAGMR